MDPNKILHAHFFRTNTGKEPVRDVIIKMTTVEKKKIGEDIKSVEFGWPLGLPVCRSMGRGLWEVRTELDKRIFRVLFGIDGELMILLHAFVKKAQKTQQKDLDLAHDRWRTHGRKKKGKKDEQPKPARRR